MVSFVSCASVTPHAGRRVRDCWVVTAVSNVSPTLSADPRVNPEDKHARGRDDRISQWRSVGLVIGPEVRAEAAGQHEQEDQSLRLSNLLARLCALALPPPPRLQGAAKVAERPSRPWRSTSPNRRPPTPPPTASRKPSPSTTYSSCPAYSQVLPSATDTRTRLTRTIPLNIPIISAAMDTVTEAAMAIAMAQQGGIGVIHKNLEAAEQAAQVRRVKKFEVRHGGEPAHHPPRPDAGRCAAP